MERIYSSKELKQADLLEYIGRLNKCPEIRKINVRTIVGLDATGSMGGVLGKACLVIGESFERVYKVL